MPIEFHCSKCNHKVTVEENALGASPTCPWCRTVLLTSGRPRSDAPKRDPFLNEHLSHYHIETLLGEGGMGKVYLARNVKLNRVCVLKILPESFAKQDRSRLDRFVREAQTAASVEHPNVLPVYFIGNEGDTYFIEMQYVDGGTIRDLLGLVGRAEPRVAARIVRDVARGLAAAHAKGIIHRDIKPTNVLLTKDGTVKVGDFGLAKSFTTPSNLTEEGVIIGTPLYMSPEHARNEKTDGRSDIYSLGILFYEMLAGRPPFTADSALALLAQHERSPLPDLRTFAPEVPREIEDIVRKMTMKAAEERYQDCSKLIRDLEEVLKTPTAVAAVEVPSAKRKKWLMVAGAVALIAMVGLAALWLVPRPGREAARQDPPVSGRVSAVPGPGSRAARPSGDGPAAGLTRSPAAASRAVAPTVAETARSYIFWKSLGPKLPVPAPGGEVEQLPAGVIQEVRHSPTGKPLAVAHSFGVDLWDTQRWVIARRLDGRTKAVIAVDFSADGSRLATGSCDDMAIVWDAEGGKETARFPALKRLTSIALSPAGNRVAAGTPTGAIVWDVDTGRQAGAPLEPSKDLRALAFSPSGAQVACGAKDGSIGLWDIQSSRKTAALNGHIAGIRSLAFSPDGRLLASGCADGAVLIWDVPTGRKKIELTAHKEDAHSLSFSRDGVRLASAGSCGVALWDVTKDDPLWRAAGRSCRGVSFSPDGTCLAVGHRFGSDSVQVFDAKNGKEIRRLAAYGSEVASVAFSPLEPRLLLSAIFGAAQDGYQLVDVENEKVLLALPGAAGGAGGPGQDPSFASSGRAIAGFSVQTADLPDKGIVIRDARTGEILHVLERANDQARCLAVSPDGSRIAYRWAENSWKVCDLKSGEKIAAGECEKGDIVSLTFLRDGKALATGCVDGRIRLWDAASGRMTRVIEAPGAVRSLAFGPKRNILAYAATESVAAQNLDSDERIEILKGRFNESVLFTPDEAELVCLCLDGTVRLWDSEAKRLTQELMSRHRGVVWCVSISCDGRMLATSSLDGTIGLWRRGQK